MRSFFVIFCVLAQFVLAFSATIPNSLENNLTEFDKKLFRKLFAVAQKDVTFRLFSRLNPTNYEEIFTGHLSYASFNETKLFKFIIHGYNDNAGKRWVLEMKDEYLKKGDYNVVAVDWSRPASSILYPISASNTNDVGKFLAQLILDLNKTRKVPYENIHLIGHSLGAHVGGYAGQYTIEFTEQKIGRISGMDPAGPSFVDRPPNKRLSADDALFVDVIHTSGMTLGYMEICGHVDFYPNGGSAVQPGCLTRDPKGVIIGCSHSRSHIFFTESINSLGFVSKECDNLRNYKEGKCNSNPTTVMGENVDISAEGVFYLTTNWKAPFGRFGEI